MRKCAKCHRNFIPRDKGDYGLPDDFCSAKCLMAARENRGYAR